MMDRKQAKEKIEKWLEKLPDAERDVPYFKVGNRLVTPKEAIGSLSATRGKNAEVASSITDKLDPDTDTPIVEEDIDDIVTKQLDVRYSKIPEEQRKLLKFGLFGSDILFTLDELMEEIRNKTDIGKCMIDNNKLLYLDFIKKLEA